MAELISKCLLLLFVSIVTFKVHGQNYQKQLELKAEIGKKELGLLDVIPITIELINKANHAININPPFDRNGIHFYITKKDTTQWVAVGSIWDTYLIEAISNSNNFILKKKEKISSENEITPTLAVTEPGDYVLKLEYLPNPISRSSSKKRDADKFEIYIPFTIYDFGENDKEAYLWILQKGIRDYFVNPYDFWSNGIPFDLIKKFLELYPASSFVSQAKFLYARGVCKKLQATKEEVSNARRYLQDFIEDRKTPVTLKENSEKLFSFCFKFENK